MSRVPPLWKKTGTPETGTPETGTPETGTPETGTSEALSSSCVCFCRPDKKCLSEKCLVQKPRYFIKKASYYVNPIMKSAADTEINSFAAATGSEPIKLRY